MFFGIIQGVFLGLSTQYIEKELIKSALISTITIFITFLCVGFSVVYFNYDLTWMGIYLLMALLALLGYRISLIFIQVDDNFKKIMVTISILLFSIFIIYERKQTFDHGGLHHGYGSGYTDNLYIALGYLPGKDTEYALKLNSTDNLMTQLEIKKDIKGFDLIFNLNDDLTNIGDAREAYIELNKVF